jgi:cytochrome c oxidase subunit IV
MCLFVSLHESLGFTRWALAVAVVSLAVELAIDRFVHVSTPGVALTAAGAIGALLALAPLIGQLRSPGRMLATALWIK